jgi:hypothetical protein
LPTVVHRKAVRELITGQVIVLASPAASPERLVVSIMRRIAEGES